MRAYLEIRRVDAIEVVDLDGEGLTIGRVETNDVQFPEDDTVSLQAIAERSVPCRSGASHAPSTPGELGRARPVRRA